MTKFEPWLCVNNICSPPFGRGWGRGVATAKEEKKTSAWTFSPRGFSLLAIARSFAPPLTPPTGRGICLFRASDSMQTVTLEIFSDYV